MRGPSALRLFFSYCRNIWRIALGISAALIGLYFLTIFYHAPMELPVYTTLLTGAVCGVFFASGFARFLRRHAELRTLLAQCNTKLAPLPSPSSLLEQDWEAIVHALEANRLAAEQRDFLRQQDASEYYTLWAHQIKTPLAAMQLLIQETPDLPCRSEFIQELFKTGQYVDMVLGYLRLESMHNDLVPRTLCLQEIIHESVRHVSTLFIHKKSVRLIVDKTDLLVTTDAKWLCFVVEQILTNAVKYTPLGTVHILVKDGALLVKDTGIGIHEEDLPRIFERGFTGCNGRSSAHSTGLGLYLCRQICQRLGHTITISSHPGQGTQVCLRFDRPQLMMD